MRPSVTGLIAIGGIAIAIFSAAKAAEIGSSNGPAIQQQEFRDRIDRLTQPLPPGGRPDQPPASGGDNRGSFPRSFLIPGTSTSVRIGGTVDATIGYTAR